MNTLFDILTGKYTDEQPVNSIPNEEDIAQSIRSHLIRLLNTRQGSLPHLPDYGLPDINEIFQGLPHNISSFIGLIKACVTKYEPRLTEIEIKYTPRHDLDYVLCLEIYAKVMQGEKLKYTTFFMSGGKATIN